MAKVPALPPSPMLLKDSVPEKARRFQRFLFWPLALLFGFLLLVIFGFAQDDFLLALILGLIGGPIIGWVLIGPPFTVAEVRRAYARIPPPPPDKRPFLFFPAALLAAALLYAALGIVLTSTPLDEDLVLYVALLASLPAAVALAYLRFGFPRPKGGLRGLKSPLQKIPEEKRPLLFVPLSLLIAAPIYFLLGVALTEALEPDIAVLLAILGALGVGFAIAYRLVGVPRPRALLTRMQHLPEEVPTRARAPAFFAFVLLVGAAFALLLGGTVGALDFINVDLAFPLFLLAGWLLAVPFAGKLFGYPVPEKPLREYVPKLPAEQRPAALLPLTLGLGVAFLVLLGLALGETPADVLADPYLLSALAFPLAFLVALRVLRIRARQLDPHGIADVPERARPLVLFALWLFVGTVLYTAIGQVLTGFLEAVLVCYALGLALALLLVDRPLLWEVLGERAARKQKAREIEARLRAEMGLQKPEPQSAARARPGRFGRRGKGKA